MSIEERKEYFRLKKQEQRARAKSNMSTDVKDSPRQSKTNPQSPHIAEAEAEAKAKASDQGESVSQGGEGGSPPPLTHPPGGETRYSRTQPTGWPSTEAQAGAMGEMAGVPRLFAVTAWSGAEGTLTFPLGGFAHWVKWKYGHDQADANRREAEIEIREQARAEAAKKRRNGSTQL
jgi:hypothetical protein